jgi:quinol-cytochrome oxidoreductase complex cytochrome b subunit
MSNSNVMRIINIPLISILNSHIIDYPTPSNINYFWDLGALAGLCLAIQIITGILLAMHYTAHVDWAFNSIEHIMRDVNNGWLIRYVHSNGASMFFIVTYIHIGRGLYFKSYRKTVLWYTGIIIFFLMIMTAFMGYVLPWGQMSFWGATVITNLFSAVPLVGESIAKWLWGGFSVANPTLNRFFSLHYLVPFLIVGLVLTHISILHVNGSTNPLGICSKADQITFYPYFYIKDLFAFLILIFIFSFFVFFSSNTLGHPDNYIRADSIVTPTHIIPEWYEREVCGAFLAGIVFNFNVNHIGSQFGVTTIGCYVTGLFLTLITAIDLLSIELQLLVKPLMKELFSIRCRKKFRFVFKMLNSDLNLMLSACLTGASTALRYCNTQAIQLIWN